MIIKIQCSILIHLMIKRNVIEKVRSSRLALTRVIDKIISYKSVEFEMILEMLFHSTVLFFSILLDCKYWKAEEGGQ